MNLYEKLSLLGPAAQYDTCGPRDFGNTTNIPGVYHAKVSGGRVCRLFKVLQSNTCKNNCYYCAFRRDRDSKRVTLSPDEMAGAFLSAYQRRLVDGFFLSSGIMNNADFTMTKILDTANILRNKLNYSGYLHLKIMPGASDDCIKEAVHLSDRISLNIESATQEGLATLSPEKDLKKQLFNTLIRMRREANKAKSLWGKSPSITTQFVVGAGVEKDIDIVNMTSKLYKRFSLSRVFFSPFRPVADTPLQDREPQSLTRAHRLYQTDFLMRFYNFMPEEIPFFADGSLNMTIDPKMAWAQSHPEIFPININTAPYQKLLRVPGVGPVSAKKIIEERAFFPIWTLRRLVGMGLQLKKISDFINF